MRAGLELGRKQRFRYEELRRLQTDRERVNHCILNLPPIGCPQPNYKKMTQRLAIQLTVGVSRNSPEPLALKSANDCLNMVAVGNAGAGVNYPEHLTYTPRDDYVLGVLLEAVVIPWRGGRVEANGVYVGDVESAVRYGCKYIAREKENQKREDERGQNDLREGWTVVEGDGRVKRAFWNGSSGIRRPIVWQLVISHSEGMGSDCRSQPLERQKRRKGDNI